MDKQLEHEVFLKTLRFRTIFPFHIKNINDQIFDSYRLATSLQKLSKTIPSLNTEINDGQWHMVEEISNWKKPEQIRHLLNNVLIKIAHLTSSDNHVLFQEIGRDRLNHPLYIRNNKDFATLKVLGDVLEDYRFTYVINISKQDPLFKLVEQIQLGFYLDKDKKQISGAFSLNSGKEDHDLDFGSSLSRHYVLELVKRFMKAQLYPLSLNNLLDITFDRSWKQNNKNSLNKQQNLFKELDFDNISLEELHHNWKKFIHRKFLQFKQYGEEVNKRYENELFYSILTVSLIMLFLLQEINTFFTTNKPELILSILGKVSNKIEQDYISYKDRYEKLASYVQTNLERNMSNTYNDAQEIHQIRDLDDFLEALSSYNVLNDNNVFITDFISTYELSQPYQINFLDKKHLFYSLKFKTFFLMLLFPELYSLSIQNTNMIEYLQLWNIYDEEEEMHMPKMVNKMVDDAICELNNNYISFISNESVVILKNQGEYLLDPSGNVRIGWKNARNEDKRLFNNYFWAEIYLQSKIYQRDYLERQVSQISLARRWKQKKTTYEKIISNLNTLRFDKFDNFYENSEFKNIIEKINKISNLNQSIETINEQTNNAYWLTLESLQRKVLVFAFIVAALQISEVFIMTVFTVLANISEGFSHQLIYGVVGAVSVISFISLCVILWTVWRYLSIRRYARKIKLNMSPLDLS